MPECGIQYLKDEYVYGKIFTKLFNTSVMLNFPLSETVCWYHDDIGVGGFLMRNTLCILNGKNIILKYWTVCRKGYTLFQMRMKEISYVLWKDPKNQPLEQEPFLNTGTCPARNINLWNIIQSSIFTHVSWDSLLCMEILHFLNVRFPALDGNSCLPGGWMVVVALQWGGGKIL